MLMPPEEDGRQDWVPESVMDMAGTLPVGSLPAGRNLIKRLLTDPRMEAVWRELQKEKNAKNISQVAINALPSWRRLDGASLRDQACAALFAFVVLEFSSNREVGTRAQFDKKLAKRWLDSAELCEWAVENEPRVRIDRELTTAITLAGAYFKSAGQLREQKDSPYVLGRGSRKRHKHSDETRGRTRRLAAEMHKIFGSFYYTTTATIAMVALKVDEIDVRDVRNWCSDLVARRRSHPAT